MKKVDLSLIIDAFSMSGIDYTTYFNINTYEVRTISEMEKSDYGIYSEKEDVPEWIEDTVKFLDELIYDEDWIVVDIDPYQGYKILEKFCYQIEDDDLSEIISVAIRGKGAFSRFRYFAEKHDLLNDWYDFEQSEYKKLAILWCEENDVSFYED
jgi:hypothetical protein